MSTSASVFDWIDPTTNAAAQPMLQPVLLASRKNCNGEGTPCKASMPHFKTVWEKYKDKGVVFIGESGDGKTTGKSLAEIREKITAFTTSNGYLWTQCASGSFSPIATKCGINAIPHVMVIGRDGKIFKYQARGGEEAAIEGALIQEIK